MKSFIGSKRTMKSVRFLKNHVLSVVVLTLALAAAGLGFRAVLVVPLVIAGVALVSWAGLFDDDPVEDELPDVMPLRDLESVSAADESGIAAA